MEAAGGQPISVAGLKELQAESIRLETEIERIKREVLAPLQDELIKLDAKIMTALMENDLDSFKSEYGTFYITRQYTYQTPKSIEDKKAFGKWLTQKGGADVFWDKLTFNHQTVQGICKEEMADAKETGDMDREIPGIKEPSVRETLAKRGIKK